MSTGTDKPLTPKMDAFVAAWVKTSGNASEAYRQAYDTSRMDDATIRKRASELLQHEGVKAAVDKLRKAAADKAEVDAAWIISQLVENVEIAMGRKRIKQRAQRRDRETGEIDVIELEVTDRDGNVAAKSLDLLAKMVGAYEVDDEQRSPNGSQSQEVPRDTGKDHLAELAKRYGTGLRIIQGGQSVPAKNGRTE